MLQCIADHVIRHHEERKARQEHHSPINQGAANRPRPARYRIVLRPEQADPAVYRRGNTAGEEEMSLCKLVCAMMLFVALLFVGAMTFFSSDDSYNPLSWPEETDSAYKEMAGDVFGSTDNIVSLGSAEDYELIYELTTTYDGPCESLYKEFLIAQEYGAFDFSCTGDDGGAISSYSIRVEDEARMKKEMLLNRISELEDQLGELLKTLDDNAQIVE